MWRQVQQVLYRNGLGDVPQLLPQPEAMLTDEQQDKQDSDTGGDGVTRQAHECKNHPHWHNDEQKPVTEEGNHPLLHGEHHLTAFVIAV